MTCRAPLRGAPAPDGFIGPIEPPMIRWQREGEPGWPFDWPGGPLPGTVNAPVPEPFRDTLTTSAPQT